MIAADTPPKPKRRRWVACGFAVVLLGAGVFTYHHLTDPERIRTLVEAQLQRYAGGLVTVGRAEFSLFHGTSLYDVVVRSPETGEVTTLPPVFSCRQIKATYSPWGTIVGRPQIDTLIALEPTCTIVYDQKDRQTNLARALRKLTSHKPATVHSLPIIELRHARVQVIARDEDQDRIVQDWRLTVRGRSSLIDDTTYDIVWQSTDLVDGARAGGHSQLDLRSGAVRDVEGGLPRMSIEAVMLAVRANTDGTGDWADLIGINGNVRVTHYNLSPPDNPSTARSVTIDLTNASLSIPVNAEEATLPRSQRYVRFSNVKGTATVSAKEIVADFVGVFHGSRCQVRGTVALPIDPKRLHDFGFDMNVSFVGLELPQLDRADRPDEARAIRGWPAIARLYDRYHPAGKADVQIELYRLAEQPGPPRMRHVRITPRDGSTIVQKFPYRLDHLTGSIIVGGSGGTVALRGDHGDARVTIDSHFGKLGGDAPAEVHVVGKNVPLDEDLRAAIPSTQRHTWDLFAPVGTANLDVHITRSASTPEIPPLWTTTTHVTFDDLSARFQSFPYLLRHLQGSIQLSKGHAIIDEIVSQVGDTRLHGIGTVSYDNGHTSEVQLRIDGQHIPFDDALLDSLPDHARRAVAAFHPTGFFDFSTALTQTVGSNRLRHDTKVTLRGGTWRHDDLPVLVTDVRGELHITREETIVTNVTGRYGSATIQADGRIDHATGQPTGTITFTNLHPSAELFAALPQPWRDEVASLTVDGAVDVTVRVPPSTGSPDGDHTSVTITWNGPSVILPQLPVPIENVRGTLVVDERGARAMGITGRYRRAKVNADIAVSFGGPTRSAEISADIRGLALDDSLRRLLSGPLQEQWDRLSPGGSVDLTLDRLRYEDRGSGTPTWHASGQAKLRNVSMGSTAGLDRATGVVSFSGMIRDRLGGTVLNGTIDLVGLRISERKLTQFNADWSLLRTVDGTGRLACDPIEASVYGGSVDASLHVMLEPDGTRYELSTKLKDVDLAPLLRPTHAATPPQDDATRLQGRTNIQLDISGIFGDTRSRRGRASLEISDGKIYKLPIVLAMLQVLNLSMPNRDSLDAIVASGFVDGDEVIVTDARISGREMALVGQGKVTLPILAAEFYFVSVNPNRWTRIPVLADVIDRASRGLVGLSISGTLHDPIVKPQAFRSIADELDRLFVKRKPKNRRDRGR